MMRFNMAVGMAWLKGLATFLLAFAVVCPAVAGGQASAAESVAVVFTGNSLGWYNACDSCGRGGIGGLGRRSSALQEIRETYGDRSLVVGGPYEFRSFLKAQAEGSEAEAKALAKAYGMFDYDLLCLSPDERMWMQKHVGSIPEGWETLQDRPQTRVLEAGGLKFGFVLFPMPQQAQAGAHADMARWVTASADELRREVDIVLGISPWGERAERNFLREHDDAFDVLMGVGPGMGSGYAMSPGGKTVWLRSFFDGRGILLLEIMDDFVANPQNFAGGGSFRVTKRELDGSVKYDPVVSNIFSWL